MDEFNKWVKSPITAAPSFLGTVYKECKVIKGLPKNNGLYVMKKIAACLYTQMCAISMIKAPLNHFSS